MGTIENRLGEVGTNAQRRTTSSRLPTIFDVARLAGVGKTTVSDAIQGRGRMTPETRAHVLAVAEELGYRVHVGARNLIKQRTEVIGVVVGDLFDPFCAELTAHLELLAAQRGFGMLLTTAGSDLAAEANAVTSLVEHRVAAIVVVSFTGNQSALHAAGSHMPVICIGYEGPYGVSIGVDDRRGGRLGTEHLLQLGHRHIGYVSNSGMPQKTDRDRRDSYRRVLRRAGISPDPQLIMRLPAPDKQERFARLREMLSRPDRPTAVFAVSDITAIELMSCAGELGLRVPEDLSVVGFDDIMVASMPMIALTTVAQPMAELAQRGIDAAIALIEDPCADVAVQRAEPRLVVRGTTAAPPSDRARRPAVSG
ncbi:MAG: LacI family DNA-binding transcriptional regulator [Solirubrobacteraceae bacterium]